jgi:hypothetical protein
VCHVVSATIAWENLLRPYPIYNFLHGEPRSAGIEYIFEKLPSYGSFADAARCRSARAMALETARVHGCLQILKSGMVLAGSN